MNNILDDNVWLILLEEPEQDTKIVKLLGGSSIAYKSPSYKHLRVLVGWVQIVVTINDNGVVYAKAVHL